MGMSFFISYDSFVPGTVKDTFVVAPKSKQGIKNNILALYRRTRTPSAKTRTRSARSSTPTVAVQLEISRRVIMSGPSPGVSPIFCLFFLCSIGLKLGGVIALPVIIVIITLFVIRRNYGNRDQNSQPQYQHQEIRDPRMVQEIRRPHMVRAFRVDPPSPRVFPTNKM